MDLRSRIAAAVDMSGDRLRRALIVGLGESGRSAAKLLERAGIECAYYDDGRHICGGDDRSAMSLEQIADGVDIAVLNPAVAHDHPVVAALCAKGIRVISELQLGDAVCDARKIAVGGTNGKTTTVSLIAHILRGCGMDARALGNIGKPFSSEAAEMPQYGVAVLEVSSFMLECGGVGADVAVLLNVTPDHLDRHVDFADYARTKARMFERQHACDKAVFNADDAVAFAIASKVKSETYFFSTLGKCRGAYRDGSDIFFDGGDGAKRVCGLDCIKLVGEHNLSDCLAAIAACKLFGASDDAIAKGLSTFNAPKYRLEYICTYHGTAVFNDSKATNIDGTIAACEAMKGTTALIVGGYDKKLSYHGFFSRLPSGVKYLICCGANSDSIIECAPRDLSARIFRTATLERAVMLGLSLGTDNLLFSPSTSSYDAYLNYRERGRHFEQAVRTFCA